MRLAGRGVDVEHWLGSHPRRYPFARAARGVVVVSLEQEPLRVLQMGNYFKTCLSVGSPTSANS